MDIVHRKKKSRGPLAWSLVALVIVLFATLGLRRLKAAPPTVDRATVWVDTVQRGALELRVQGQGTLVPVEVRLLSAVVTARVESIPVRAGSAVEEDTVVVVLTNPDLQLAALEADRQLASAEAEQVNLGETLHGELLAQKAVIAGLDADAGDAGRRAVADEALAQKGYLSQLERGQSRDRARALSSRMGLEGERLGAQSRGNQARLAAGRAQVERLRSIARFRHQQLDALTVRAGSRGVLEEAPLQLGQWVAPGTPLGRVARADHLKAEVRIAEVQARDIVPGQRAQIDTRNGVSPGRVTRVDPSARGGTVTVEVAFDDEAPRGARSGQSIEGTIELAQLADVVYVGRPALAQPGSSARLWKLAGDEAVRVPVQLGRASVQKVEVRGGLAEGDQVILSDLTAWDAVDRIRLH